MAVAPRCSVHCRVAAALPLTDAAVLRHDDADTMVVVHEALGGRDDVVASGGDLRFEFLVRHDVDCRRRRTHRRRRRKGRWGDRQAGEIGAA